MKSYYVRYRKRRAIGWLHTSAMSWTAAREVADALASFGLVAEVHALSVSQLTARAS